MDEKQSGHPDADEMWRVYLTTGRVHPDAGSRFWHDGRQRRLARLLPAEPRCRLCYFPFSGSGGWLLRNLFGIKSSRMNPQICNICERAAAEAPGGAEVELSVLFADIRGSTALGEQMSPAEFGKLIDRFYRQATNAVFHEDGMVEKLVGDEVVGFFVPGFAGSNHAGRAIKAGEAILRATGHGRPKGPWAPVGVGVHTGIAYVGSVAAADSEPDIAVLGDVANTGSRIASQAGPGELLFSEESRLAAGLDSAGMESRTLVLKGKKEPQDVWVRILV